MSVTPPTDAQLKQLVVDTAGDVNGIVAANIDLIWSIYAPYSPYPPLQYLYSLRASLELLAGQVWQMVDAAVDDARESLSDKYRHLRDRIDQINEDIVSATPGAMGVAGLSVASGVLVTTAPSSPPSGWPDANDPRYIGWVYSFYGWRT
jgi:hypothetical protein